MKSTTNLYIWKHFVNNDYIPYYMDYEKNILSGYFNLIMRMKYIAFEQY